MQKLLSILCYCLLLIVSVEFAHGQYSSYNGISYGKGYGDKDGNTYGMGYAALVANSEIDDPTPSPTPTATVSGPNLVQQKTGTATGSTITVTFDTPVTAGNFVVVLISLLGASDISDSTCVLDGGGGMDPVATSAGTGLSSQINISGAAVGGETGIIFTLIHLGTGVIVVNAQEWSTFTSVNVATNTNADAGSATVTTGSVTPAFASNVVFAVGAWTADSYSSGPTNGFTRLTPINGAGIYQEGAYLIQSSATEKSTGWSLSGSLSWAAAIAEVDQGP